MVRSMGEKNVLVLVKNTLGLCTNAGSFAAHETFMRLAEENRKAIQVSFFLSTVILAGV